MLSTTKVLTRGGTVQWKTTFYDANGVIAQPDSATLNVAFDDASGTVQTQQVVMTAPTAPGDVQWTALWDSRNVFAPMSIYWSIHTGTDDPIPVSVEDGVFQLQANPANLVTF